VLPDSAAHMTSSRQIRPCALAVLASLLLAAARFLIAFDPAGLISMVAVGDIMLSRNVAAKMRDADDPLLPFRNVSALLDDSDLVFGNLESPLAPPEEEIAGESPDESKTGWDGIVGGKSLVFAAPNKSVLALSRYRFRLVAMANNHALDRGEAGITHSIRRLSANNIQVAGAGGSLEEAWQARIVELKDRKIAFLAVSYASWNYGTDERNEYVARIEDLERLKSRVRALKSQADYIVVCMHAGEEYTGEPARIQVEFAHAAIDAGVNLVVGSHPHWLQPLERYKTGLIFYSLGNFIFDLDSSLATREGAAVRLIICANGLVSAEVFPIEIENSCCPRLARPDEIPRALRRMGLTSTHVQLLRGAR
jgi:poly-gamma-glutamate synthesis protein (capsule biosynthesis protein)